VRNHSSVAPSYSCIRRSDLLSSLHRAIHRRSGWDGLLAEASCLSLEAVQLRPPDRCRSPSGRRTREPTGERGDPIDPSRPRLGGRVWLPPYGPRLPRGDEGAEDVTAMKARIWGLSKSAANYRPAPKPEVRCDACKYMFPRVALGGCRLVRGVIQGSATCDEFTPRNRQ